MGNPFENNVVGASGGYRETDDSSRPNKEALEAKRDEYLADAVNDVIKNYDQKKINKIAEHIKSMDADEEARDLLKELILDTRDYLMEKHGIDIEEISPAGSFDAREKRIWDSYEEVVATYPDELIQGFIRGILTTGHY